MVSNAIGMGQCGVSQHSWLGGRAGTRGRFALVDSMRAAAGVFLWPEVNEGGASI